MGSIDLIKVISYLFGTLTIVIEALFFVTFNDYLYQPRSRYVSFAVTPSPLLYLILFVGTILFILVFYVVLYMISLFWVRRLMLASDQNPQLTFCLKDFNLLYYLMVLHTVLLLPISLFVGLLITNLFPPIFQFIDLVGIPILLVPILGIASLVFTIKLINQGKTGTKNRPFRLYLLYSPVVVGLFVFVSITLLFLGLAFLQLLFAIPSSIIIIVIFVLITLEMVLVYFTFPARHHEALSFFSSSEIRQKDLERELFPAYES